MKVHARDDGLYDVESHLLDTKPLPFRRFGRTDDWPAGKALHDLNVRLTVDDKFVVRAAEAASDVTPFDICRGAESTLAVLVGEKIARGWSARVKELLRGAASCTHLMEMLIPMGTAALQGIRGIKEREVTLDADGVPHKVDSCYAFGREREIVLKFWPQHFRRPSR